MPGRRDDVWFTYPALHRRTRLCNASFLPVKPIAGISAQPRRRVGHRSRSTAGEHRQILAEADMCGADRKMRTRLYALPVRLYENCADVAGAMGVGSCPRSRRPPRRADIFRAVPRA